MRFISSFVSALFDIYQYSVYVSVLCQCGLIRSYLASAAFRETIARNIILPDTRGGLLCGCDDARLCVMCTTARADAAR